MSLATPSRIAKRSCLTQQAVFGQGKLVLLVIPLRQRFANRLIQQAVLGQLRHSRIASLSFAILFDSAGFRFVSDFVRQHTVLTLISAPRGGGLF